MAVVREDSSHFYCHSATKSCTRDLYSLLQVTRLSVSAVYGLRVEMVVFHNRNFDYNKIYKKCKNICLYLLSLVLLYYKNNNSNNLKYYIMKIVYNYNDSIITQDFMQKVADFEGFSSKPYRCPSGVLTIGFGHTLVFSQTSIDVESASNVLFDDLSECCFQLSSYLESFRSFPTGLQQALIDFVFNCGIGRFLSSGMYRILKMWNSTSEKHREILLVRVCDSLSLYVYSKGKRLEGLIKRRQWEISLINGCLSQR